MPTMDEKDSNWRKYIMITAYLNFWLSVQGISQIIEIFEKEKHDIRFVGGCVRDALLGNKNSDIDFSINCNPDITAKLLIKNNIEILEYGKKYGTITAVIGKKNIEITIKHTNTALI